MYPNRKEGVNYIIKRLMMSQKAPLESLKTNFFLIPSSKNV